jgi:hypothetical protein
LGLIQSKIQKKSRDIINYNDHLYSYSYNNSIFTAKKKIFIFCNDGGTKLKFCRVVHAKKVKAKGGARTGEIGHWWKWRAAMVKWVKAINPNR